MIKEKTLANFSKVKRNTDIENAEISIHLFITLCIFLKKMIKITMKWSTKMKVKKRMESKFAKYSHFESNLFGINLYELVRSFVLTKNYLIYFLYVLYCWVC